MKRFSITSPLLLGILVSSTGLAEEMTLRFNNGDELNGRLVEFDDAGLAWESKAFAGPQRFRLAPLEEIEIPVSSSLNLPEGNHVAEVTLTNEDELRGCLTKVTDTEIGLMTEYGGELTLRRDMVDALQIEDRPDPIYIGPSGLDGWVQSVDEGWTYESSALVCQRSSSIGRDIGRHERIRIAFDISWRDNARFRLFLHADTEDPNAMQNGYELVCQSQYAYLRKKTVGDSSTIGSSGGIREFTDREKIRFEILQDLKTGRIRLMIDGRVVDDWQEGAPSPEKMGSFIHFAADRANGTQLSRIMVTSWDGLIDGEWDQAGQRARNRAFQLRNMNFEEPDEPEPVEEDPDIPGIKLRNGDKIAGEILEIGEGMVRLKTSFKELSLPVSRLRSFALRTAEEAANPELRWEPIRRQGDIRAWFSDGGHVTFQLVGLEDGKLIGRSQTFGEARFDLDSFCRLEFNIYPRVVPGG